MLHFFKGPVLAFGVRSGIDLFFISGSWLVFG
jgi:hypothetical protein